MKKILLIGCLLCANLQAQVYNFESAASSGGITTTTVQDSTGWKRVGTTAFNTGATYYRIAGKYQRLILVDTDNDSVIIAPHALFPLAGKDATSLLFAFDSTGRLGLNALTSAQATRAFMNVLGRAANDTLLVFSNDGGGVVGDSSTFVDAAGRWSIKGGSLATSSVYFSTAGYAQATNGFISGGTEGVQQAGTGAAYNFSSSNNNLHLSPVQQVVIKAGTTVASQAFLTVRSNGIADTTFMARNDKNSTLDSTMMVFANGDGYFGGNNLYQGGHRWRSNAAGDSLILYDGNTMIMAFLSDGTIADLVAGTPPTSRRYIPPPDYIWLLRIGVFLLLLLSILMIYDFVTKLRAKRAQRERLKLLASYAIRRTDI